MYPTKGQQGFQKSDICLNGHDKRIEGTISHGTCKKCKSISDNKWKKENPLKVQAAYRMQNWLKYNILNSEGNSFTIVDFDRLYQLQQGRCAICNTHQSELKRSLNVDHNHTTKIVRGLLCSNCNQSLGLIGESIEILQSCIQYLKRGH